MRLLAVATLVVFLLAACTDSEPASSGLRTEGASAKDKAMAARVAQYFTRNGKGMKEYDSVRLIRVDNGVMTVETDLPDIAKLGRGYDVVCSWIQGSDEATSSRTW